MWLPQRHIFHIAIHWEWENAPEADRRNVPEEVISVSDGEVDRESTIGGCSSQASCSTTSSRREDAYRKAHNLWFDDPHDSDPPRVIEQRKDALRSRELQFQVGAMDDHKNLPALIGKLKIDWLM